MANSSLYDAPDLYDLAYHGNEIASFYLRLAREIDANPILELACGTGGMAIPIAQAGFDVYGVDNAPAMLERAAQKSATAGVRIGFAEGDMAKLALAGRNFSLVFVANNSLLHLLSTDAIRECFSAVARSLSDDGLFAFDIFAPSPAMLARDSTERFHVGRFQHQEIGEITLEETTNYDQAKQVNHTTYYWSTARKRDFRVTPFALRNIFPQELPLLLDGTGLALQNRFGGPDGEPFSTDSRKQFCLCRRAK